MVLEPEGRLSALVQMVDQRPDASSLAAHLSTSTFGDFGASTCALHARKTHEGRSDLILVGHFGLNSNDEHECMSVDLDFPLPASFGAQRTQVTVHDAAEVARDFPLHTPGLKTGGCLLSIPMRADGITIGVTLVSLSKELPLTASMWSFLSGVQAALNFFARFNIEDWVPMGPTHHRRGLSERQIAILRLVPLGLTNEAIANRLGYSASTIKVDLSRAMETLRVNNRHRAAAAAERWMPHDNATV